MTTAYQEHCARVEREQELLARRATEVYSIYSQKQDLETELDKLEADFAAEEANADGNPVDATTKQVFAEGKSHLAERIKDMKSRLAAANKLQKKQADVVTQLKELADALAGTCSVFNTSYSRQGSLPASRVGFGY